MGANAHPCTLNVCNAEEFSVLAADVMSNHGSVDFLFNNAGIGIGGEMTDLAVVHFDRFIDVNLRGVSNGVAAVYPLMVRQGFGSIVNTASIGGLVPTPLMVSYSITKHAIVGLSRGLRIEAREHGVNVNVLCRAAIETPLVDSRGPSDLAASLKYGIRDYVSKISKPMPATDFAAYELNKVQLNKEIIIAPKKAQLIWLLFRFFPKLILIIIGKNYKDELKKHI